MEEKAAFKGEEEVESNHPDDERTPLSPAAKAVKPHQSQDKYEAKQKQPLRTNSAGQKKPQHIRTYSPASASSPAVDML